ncbi:Hypothetical protein A7982_10485 [Minicystis rosea]|nr:Hypothetical protein A7982_10485 [Minicystis rosea]
MEADPLEEVDVPDVSCAGPEEQPARVAIKAAHGMTDPRVGIMRR